MKNCSVLFASLLIAAAVVSPVLKGRAEAQPQAQQTKFWKQIQAYDNKVAQGSLSYYRTVKIKSAPQYFDYALKYGSNGRYRERLDIQLKPKQSGEVITTVFDGNDSFVEIDNTVTISSGLPLIMSRGLPWGFRCRSPSLAADGARLVKIAKAKGAVSGTLGQGDRKFDGWNDAES